MKPFVPNQKHKTSSFVPEIVSSLLKKRITAEVAEHEANGVDSWAANVLLIFTKYSGAGESRDRR